MVIDHVDISMKDYGVAVLQMGLKGSGYGCVYGGYVLGHGHLGAKNFDGSNAGMESILRIMDVVGVDTFTDIKGKYIRAATKGCGDSLKIIGNILEDKWFDIKSFFDDKRNELGADYNELEYALNDMHNTALLAEHLRTSKRIVF